MADDRKQSRRSIIDAINEAAAINVGKGQSRTSVSTKQRVVHKDGKTRTVEERVERREG